MPVLSTSKMFSLSYSKHAKRITSMPSAIDSISTLPASPCSTVLDILWRNKKWRTHFLLAPNISSFFLSSSEIDADANSLSMAATPMDWIVARVTGSGTFFASSTNSMTSLFTWQKKTIPFAEENERMFDAMGT